MPDLLNEILFLFQRLNWSSVVDLFLVTAIFYMVLVAVRNTNAMVLMRGVIFIILLLTLLTSLVNLPAFSWLIKTILPVLLLAIPVLFAPELRRALERVGRANISNLFMRQEKLNVQQLRQTIQAIVTASVRLSARQHGALIILQRVDSLEEYERTGVKMNAKVTPELLLQVFYPNTPLHDGAAIISHNQLSAAACVMPLSSSGILNRSPERQMGLRHRAALGISEASDAIALVVSEETGSISIAHSGRMIRRLDSERLENILLAFFSSEETTEQGNLISRFFQVVKNKGKLEE
ncbi:MAG: diadenylate cyclase CdaA [bacterium]